MVVQNLQERLVNSRSALLRVCVARVDHIIVNHMGFTEKSADPDTGGIVNVKGRSIVEQC